MPRSDLLVTLINAGAAGDQRLFRKTVEAMAAEERVKNHHVLADRLVQTLQKPYSLSESPSRSLENGFHNLFYETSPKRKISDLILPEDVAASCAEVIEEQNRATLLESFNLEPRNRILLAGPPGNGKTSLAEALAEALMTPLITVRYEGIIGSYLGETASRLKRLFDYVRARRCVLFLDEFDVLGKERGDPHDTGEIKRVVSSLLMQIDELPSHVVVVTASNHPELLDRAVWRRFQLRLLLPNPSPRQATEWFSRFENRVGSSLGFCSARIAENLQGLSFAELEDFCTDVQRRYVLSLPDASYPEIVASRMRFWESRFEPANAEIGGNGHGSGSHATDSVSGKRSRKQETQAELAHAGGKSPGLGQTGGQNRADAPRT